jgi:polysaccharide export outer membrane protein
MYILPVSRSTRRPAVVNLIFALATVFTASFQSSASADYRLNPGDVLELSAVGLKELQQKSTIGPDGYVLFPLLGPIKVAGLSLPELRAKVQEVLPTKIFRRRTEDGREYPVVLNAEEIIVTIADYRPVYLDGDVARPGAQTYRPGMTVRQALALAGGYDVTRFRTRDPFLESADFRADYYALWTDFAKEQVSIARIKAELRNETDIDNRGFLQTPIPKSRAEQIEKLERQLLETRNTDFRKEREHLRRAIEQDNNRIAALSEREQKEKEGTLADARDLEEMRQNFKKGVIPLMRMAEARRVALFSATQALQTTALLAQAERERENLTRSLQRVDDDRQMKLLAELQAAEIRLETIQARLQAVGEKLMYSSIVKSQLIRGTGGNPVITIFREDNGERHSQSAAEDTELMPGDVVEVAVRLESRMN